MDHLEAAANEDNEISHDLFKFRALIGHQGPLKPTDPNWKGCQLTEFRQPIQVQSHLEMPGILVQLGRIQCT